MNDMLGWFKDLMDLIPAMRAAPVAYSSKHMREPGAGEVRFGRDSGIRKLKRALRRNMVPPERMQVIETAMRSAARRQHLYANSPDRMPALLRSARESS